MSSPSSKSSSIGASARSKSPSADIDVAHTFTTARSNSLTPSLAHDTNTRCRHHASAIFLNTPSPPPAITRSRSYSRIPITHRAVAPTPSSPLAYATTRAFFGASITATSPARALAPTSSSHLCVRARAASTMARSRVVGARGAFVRIRRSACTHVRLSRRPRARITPDECGVRCKDFIAARLARRRAAVAVASRTAAPNTARATVCITPSKTAGDSLNQSITRARRSSLSTRATMSVTPGAVAHIRAEKIARDVCVQVRRPTRSPTRCEAVDGDDDFKSARFEWRGLSRAVWRRCGAMRRVGDEGEGRRLTRVMFCVAGD